MELESAIQTDQAASGAISSGNINSVDLATTELASTSSPPAFESSSAQAVRAAKRRRCSPAATIEVVDLTADEPDTASPTSPLLVANGMVDAVRGRALGNGNSNINSNSSNATSQQEQHNSRLVAAVDALGEKN